MRSGIISPLFMLLIVPIFGIAGFFLFRSLKRGSRIISAIVAGEITRGRLVSETATNVRVNKRRVMACVFEYEVNGTRYRITARTHIPELVKDEAEEKIIYNDNDPSQAVLFDLLPVKIQRFLTSSQ